MRLGPGEVVAVRKLARRVKERGGDLVGDNLDDFEREMGQHGRLDKC